MATPKQIARAILVSTKESEDYLTTLTHNTLSIIEAVKTKDAEAIKQIGMQNEALIGRELYEYRKLAQLLHKYHAALPHDDIEEIETYYQQLQSVEKQLFAKIKKLKQGIDKEAEPIKVINELVIEIKKAKESFATISSAVFNHLKKYEGELLNVMEASKQIAALSMHCKIQHDLALENFILVKKDQNDRVALLRMDNARSIISSMAQNIIFIKRYLNNFKVDQHWFTKIEKDVNESIKEITQLVSSGISGTRNPAGRIAFWQETANLLKILEKLLPEWMAVKEKYEKEAGPVLLTRLHGIQ